MLFFSQIYEYVNALIRVTDVSSERVNMLAFYIRWAAESRTFWIDSFMYILYNEIGLTRRIWWFVVRCSKKVLFYVLGKVITKKRYPGTNITHYDNETICITCYLHVYTDNYHSMMIRYYIGTASICFLLLYINIIVTMVLNSLNRLSTK